MMIKYRSHEEVLVTPMSRAAYNSYRGWKLPDDEDGSDEGYLVERIGSPNSNHPAHKGYISWSPKDVFDKGYTKIAEETNND